MKTTFVNQNKEGNIIKIGKESLKSRGLDFKWYMKNGWNDYDDDNYNEDLAPLNEYGLCFDYVEPDTFDNQREGYYRYQLAFGGPTEEIRFYKNKTVYVYLDWFCGVGLNISHLQWSKWLREMYKEMEMLNFEIDN